MVERLVAILDAQQDLDRLAFARRFDLDGLEPPLERAVLLDVLPVLGRRGGADAADLAARERRLEDVGRVERAFGRSGAHQRVQFVDEHDDVRVLGELLHDGLEALFELSAILRAGDDQRDVEGEDPLVGEEVRDVATHDLLRQAFDDGGLAHAGLADQDGVVLGAAAQHLLDALDFDVAPHQRVEAVLEGSLGEVAAELGQQRRLLHPRQRRLLVQQRDDVFAHPIELHPLFHEDGRRHRALLAEDAQQQVLGADVVVQQAIGFFGSELQDALGFGAERDLDRRRDLLAEDGTPLDFLPDRLERQVRPRKDAAGQPLAFANQPEQQVLGFDRNTPQLAGFIACKEQHAPRSLGIPLEHPAYPTEVGTGPDQGRMPAIIPSDPSGQAAHCPSLHRMQRPAGTNGGPGGQRRVRGNGPGKPCTPCARSATPVIQ